MQVPCCYLPVTSVDGPHVTRPSATQAPHEFGAFSLFVALPPHYVGRLVRLMFASVTLTQWHGFIFRPRVLQRTSPLESPSITFFGHFPPTLIFVFPERQGIPSASQAQGFRLPAEGPRLPLATAPEVRHPTTQLVNLPPGQGSLPTWVCAEEVEDKPNLVPTPHCKMGS